MSRPLPEQVVVITGASSGIGREAALEFGRRGASVVVAARNQAALDSVAQEIEQAGGTAQAVVTDVADWAQVTRLAQAAVDRFGRIDTWVNNAAIYLVARVEDMTVEETQRLLQVNLLGQIHGMKAALPHLIDRGQGTIINVTSVTGVRGFPLLSAYSAAKHGIKGFTEALRLELARDHPGIKVVLILPLSIDTPFFTHARSKIGVLPRPLPPIYEPDPVVEAIVFAAEHPRRDIYIGPGRLLAMTEGVMPALLDRLALLGDLVFKLQKTDQPDDGRDNFFAPMPADTYAMTGQWGTEAAPTSRYTRYLELHPVRQLAMLGAVVTGGLLLIRRLGRSTIKRRTVS